MFHSVSRNLWNTIVNIKHTWLTFKNIYKTLLVARANEVVAVQISKKGMLSQIVLNLQGKSNVEKKSRFRDRENKNH